MILGISAKMRSDRLSEMIEVIRNYSSIGRHTLSCYPAEVLTKRTTRIMLKRKELTLNRA